MSVSENVGTNEGEGLNGGTWFSLSERAASKLPVCYTIRSLQESDYDHGYMECLAGLTVVGDVDKESFIGK